MSVCEHVYKNTVIGDCLKCGRPTHDMDWQLQNKMMKKWHEDNPDAEYAGWTSI